MAGDRVEGLLPRVPSPALPIAFFPRPRHGSARMGDSTRVSFMNLSSPHDPPAPVVAERLPREAPGCLQDLMAGAIRTTVPS